jgi:GNAT superfamily N-acetyltransferase
VVTIELLADVPELVDAVGEIRWREWGRPPEPAELSWWVDVTRREAGRDRLPVTFVAVGTDGSALGAVGLGEFDIDERRDRSPWILGMVVRPDHRGRGIGQRLMTRVERYAAERGYPDIWVATGHAAPFYEHCGWRHTESLTLPTGHPTSILTKPLSLSPQESRRRL